MMFKTDNEYYADTTHVSSSMVKAYLRSPSYYKALYIDKIIDGPSSTAIDYGSALDTLLTEGKKKFNKSFTYNTTKANDPEMFEKNKIFDGIKLSKAQYDSVLMASDVVQKTDAYKWIKKNNPQKQTILTGELFGVKIKGKLDFLNIVDSQVAVITDLKTTTNLHPTKYYYHILDFYYHVQMAMYRELVKQSFGVSHVICQHLVVTKNEWPQVATFIFSEAMLEKGLELIKDSIMGISKGNFNDPKVSWDNAFLIDVKNILSKPLPPE